MVRRMPEEDLLSNRAAWDGFAADFVEPGHKSWSNDEVKWGIFGIPNAEIGFLLDVEGLDLGSGRRLSPDGAAPTPLRLVDTKTTTTGVVIATYEPAEATD